MEYQETAAPRIALLVAAFVVALLAFMLAGSPGPDRGTVGLESAGAERSTPSRDADEGGGFALPESRSSTRQPLSSDQVLLRAGAGSGISGDGVLFLRASQVGGEGTLHAVEIFGMRGSLGELAASSFRPVAAVLGGVPFQILNVSNVGEDGGELAVDVEPSPNHLIVVRGERGEPVESVSVARPDGALPGEQPSAQPAWVRDEDVVASGDGLLWVAKPPTSQYWWIGAPGHEYALWFVDSKTPEFCEFQLGPASDLLVRILGEALLDRLSVSVSVSGDGGLDLTTGPLSRRTLVMQGLPSGEAAVLLRAAVDPDAAPHAESSVVLVHGERSVVEFGADVVDIDSSGWIELTVLLNDEALPWYLLNELKLEISFAAKVQGASEQGHAEHQPRAAAGRIRVPISTMAPLDEAGSILFCQVGQLEPGGYRVEARPFGVFADTWVFLGQGSDVTVDLGQLSTLRLQFEDESDGALLDVRATGCVRLTEYVSHGRDFKPSTRFYTDPDDGSIVYVGVPGEIAVGVQGEVCGSFWHKTYAHTGRHSETVLVSRATWVDLKFYSRDGRDVVGSRWFGRVELFDGVDWIAPRWHSFQLVDGGTTTMMSLSVSPSHAFDLQFIPDEGYPPIDSIRVPQAAVDPQSIGRFQRRSVDVMLGSP